MSKVLIKNVPMPVNGLNTGTPGEFITPQQFTDIKNMQLYRNQIQKRYGTTVVGSNLNSERVQYITELQINTNVYVLAMGLTKVNLLNVAAQTWSSIGYQNLTGLTSDRFSSCVPNLSGAKILVYTNGIDPVRKYTGSGNDAALGGSPPLARFSVAYQSYLVLAYVVSGGNTYYSRLQWSDTGAPETWSIGAGSNAGTLDLLDDGDDITGMANWGPYFTVHKRGCIYTGYLVTTGSIFQLDRQSTGIGTAANNTIQTLPTGEQIFLAYDGVHLFNGITAPLIESPIMDEMRQTINPQFINKSYGFIVRELDEYWCAVPIGSDTEPQTVYKFNYRTHQVYKDYRTNICYGFPYDKTSQLRWQDKTTNWNTDPTRWSDVIYSNLNPTPLFGDTSGNMSQRDTVNNDLSVTIDSYFVTKDFTSADIDGGNMGTLMRWTGMQLWALGNSVTISYSLDQGQTWTALSQTNLNSNYPSDFSPLLIWFDVLSQTIRFKFENNNSAETFMIKKFLILGQEREDTISGTEMM